MEKNANIEREAELYKLACQNYSTRKPKPNFIVFIAWNCKNALSKANL